MASPSTIGLLDGLSASVPRTRLQSLSSMLLLPCVGGVKRSSTSTPLVPLSAYRLSRPWELPMIIPGMPRDNCW
eukprot:12937944-Prorocentrum_lima.AAC.1